MIKDYAIAVVLTAVVFLAAYGLLALVAGAVR